MPLPRAKNRFVLLATPRSGSNMLVSLLDAHPEISCFGELMRPTPEWMRRCGYRGALRNLEHVDPKYRDDAVRFASPQAFIDEVMTKLTSKRIVGFKLMLGQHPKFLAQLINNPAYHKVLLYRANPLAAYSSGRIAQATGQGSARAGAEIKHAKVTFDTVDFQRFLKFREHHYQVVRKRLAESNEPYLNVEYLELAAGNATPRILECLGADQSVALKPKTAKRNPSNLLERFTNPDEVRMALIQMGAEHWAIEAP